MINYTRPQIIDFEYFTSEYSLPDTNNRQEQQINVEKWINQASDYVNSICAGKPYKEYPKLLEKEASKTITDEERFQAVCLQNAICGIVEVYIQTAHIFSRNAANVQAIQSFNINTTSENSEIETLRLDIMRLLVQGGWYKTTSFYEVSDTNPTYLKNTIGCLSYQELVNRLNNEYLRYDGENTPKPPLTNFNLIASNLNNVGNITAAGNEKQTYSVLKHFKLEECIVPETEFNSNIDKLIAVTPETTFTTAFNGTSTTEIGNRIFPVGVRLSTLLPDIVFKPNSNYYIMFKKTSNYDKNFYISLYNNNLTDGTKNPFFCLLDINGARFESGIFQLDVSGANYFWVSNLHSNTTLYLNLTDNYIGFNMRNSITSNNDFIAFDNDYFSQVFTPIEIKGRFYIYEKASLVFTK